jgi:dimethyl sulfoxide reductase iron-sulfur subunit
MAYLDYAAARTTNGAVRVMLLRAARHVRCRGPEPTMQPPAAEVVMSGTVTAAKHSPGLSRRAFLGGIVGGATVAAGVGRADAQPVDGTSARLRRWAMVIDLRRCDGCVGLGLPPQCAQACIWSRYVPEGQQWLEVVERPHSDLPGAPGQFMPLPCMHCQNAPCVNACPVGATFHTPEGTVLIDQERCIGCRLCMAACPYDRRFFNWDEPVQPEFVQQAPYDPQMQTPAMRGTVMKCDLCPELAAAGGLPWCVTGCPRGACYFGDLEEDVATNGAQVVRFSDLVHDEGAFRYKESLGTEPRVYYIDGHGELAGDPVVGEALNDLLEWPWRDMAAAEVEAGHG